MSYTRDPFDTDFGPADVALDLDAIKARETAAYDELIRVCSIDQQRRISIPANPDRDTDLLISAALKDIPALVTEVENLLVEREWPSVHDLADAHARYHDQAGNLLYENDCEWLRCEFWGSVTHLLSLRPGSSDIQEADRG